MKRNSRELRDKLARDNLGFVYWMASKYHAFADNDDLVGAGFQGLLEAASRYDASRGKFSNYASWWIRKEMLLVAYQQQPVQVPHRKTTKIKKGELRYDAESTWWNSISDKQPSPAQQVEDRSMAEYLHRSMHVLTAREQYVLTLRFGLNGHARLSLEETGQAIGLSRERARQIQEKALARLRKVMV